MNWLRKLFFGESIVRYIVEFKDGTTYQAETFIDSSLFEAAMRDEVVIYKIMDDAIFKFERKMGLYKSVEKK